MRKLMMPKADKLKTNDEGDSFFYIANEFEQNLIKIKLNKFQSLTAAELAQNLKTTEAFKKLKKISGMVYRDSFFSFFIPNLVKPFESFPITANSAPASLHEESAQTKTTPFFFLIEKTSFLFQKIQIKFKHSFGFYPDLIMNIDFTPIGFLDNMKESIISALGENKWEEPMKACCEAINAKVEKLIFRFSIGSQSQLILPFGKISDIVNLIFSSSSNSLNPNCAFGYDFIEINSHDSVIFPQIHSTSNTSEIDQIKETLFESISDKRIVEMFSEIFDVLYPFLLRYSPISSYQYNHLMLSLNDVLISYINKFLSPYFQNLLTNQKKLWKKLENWVNNLITKKNQPLIPFDYDFYVGLALISCKSLIPDIIDNFNLVFQCFREPKQQSYYINGTIVFSSIVTSLSSNKYTLIMTRGIIRIFDAIPNSANHEIFPHNLSFTKIGSSPIVFISPIQNVSFVPFANQSVGFFYTQYGNLSLLFPKQRALTDFWILLNICKTDLKQNYICLPNPQAIINYNIFSDPDSIHANIKVNDTEWRKTIPMGKYTKKMKKIIPQYEAFTISLEKNYSKELEVFAKPKNFSDHTFDIGNYESNFTSFVENNRNFNIKDNSKNSIIDAIFVEAATAGNFKIRFKFLKIFGITDFKFAIKNKMTSLLCYQIKEFVLPYIDDSSCKELFEIKSLPLIRATCYLTENLEIIDQLLNNFNMFVDEDLVSSFKQQNSVHSQYLLEKKSEDDSFKPLKNSTLEYLISINQFNKIKFFVSSDEHFQAAIIWAIEHKNLELFKTLHPLCSDFELNLPDEKGRFLTHVCIENEDESSLIELASKWEVFDPNRYLLESSFCHPLHFFFEMNIKRQNILAALLSFPNIDVNFVDNSGESPLTKALSLKVENALIICLLNDHRCNVDLQNNNGKSPLFIAVNNGNYEIVSHLIKSRGSMINAPNNGFDGFDTPLMAAKRNDDETMVQFLIENGADQFAWLDYEEDTNLK